MSSPAERDQIEADYFEDDDAFQEMLSAEDDLVDAYARGELTVEERRRFENSFAGSLSGSDRVQFARAFAGVVSVTRPVKTKFSHNIFQPRGLLRMATSAAVIAFVAVLGWLLSDRTRMINELRDLHAESAELTNRTEALLRSSDTERTRSAEIAAQLAELRSQTDKPRHSESGTKAIQTPGHSPEVENDGEEVASKPEPSEKVINIQDATLGTTFEHNRITQLPLEARSPLSLLTLQPGITRDGYVAGARADQSNITLDGVSPESPDTYLSNSVGTSVRGTAKDSQGNVVSGATVTLIDSAKNFTRTQSTNKDGGYVFNAIPPGTYSIQVKTPGYKTASVSNLAVLLDTPTVLDVALEIGDVSETINITSGAEVLINRNDATIGNSFERERVTQLPLRADQSNITLNGVDATIRIPSFLSGIKFQIILQKAAIHNDYRIIVKTAESRSVTTVSWTASLTSNQAIIDTPLIPTAGLASGDYVLLLMGKESDGSFVKVAEYSFKVIK